MQSTGLAILFLGVIALFGSAFAYVYQETKRITVAGVIGYPITTNPYRDYCFPLIIVGVALFGLAFGLLYYEKRID